MVDSLNINDVEEILVRFANGDEIIYKGKGLEKFRRLLADSPAYGEVKGRRGQNVLVVDDDYSPDDDVETRVPVEKPKTKKGKPKKGPSIGPNGYHTADLDYSTGAAKGRSPMDLAREMQRQAEQASGIKF